jgi:hypothetical protein
MHGGWVCAKKRNVLLLVRLLFYFEMIFKKQDM